MSSLSFLLCSWIDYGLWLNRQIGKFTGPQANNNGRKVFLTHSLKTLAKSSFPKYSVINLLSNEFGRVKELCKATKSLWKDAFLPFSCFTHSSRMLNKEWQKQWVTSHQPIAQHISFSYHSRFTPISAAAVCFELLFKIQSLIFPWNSVRINDQLCLLLNFCRQIFCLVKVEISQDRN